MFSFHATAKVVGTVFAVSLFSCQVYYYFICKKFKKNNL